MLRFFVTLVAGGTFSGACALAEDVSGAEMVGTWRVEPSTYVVVPSRGTYSGTGRIVKKNGTELIFGEGGSILATIPELMPASFAAFALILKTNGLFVVTNVPAGFLFDWPAMAEAEGTWALRTERQTPLFGSKTYEYQYCSLDFKRPRPGRLDRSVHRVQLGPSSPQQPVMHVFVGEHRQVCLKNTVLRI